MSDGVRGIVVAHASLGQALVDAAHAIAGPTDRLVGVSNEGCGRDAILTRIEEAADGGVPTIVFVDVAGGSCHMAALRLKKTTDHVAVVAGVNLPMLLDFLLGPSADVATTAERVATAGSGSISAET